MTLVTPDLQVSVNTRLRFGGEHPFLVVRNTAYRDLQARAARSPWREQKDDALYTSETFLYNRSARIDIRAITLARILSTTTLAYILDPDDRSRHRAHIVKHLRPFDPAEPGSITAGMLANPNKMLWTHGVPTGNAFFHAVLALDIIHDEKHAKAAFTRLSVPGYTGATVRQNNVVDTLFESDGLTGVSPAPDFYARARAGFFRRPDGGTVASVWLLDAQRYSFNACQFESTSPMTLFLAADVLTIVSIKAGRITLTQPGLMQATLDDNPFPTPADHETVSLDLPTGAHVVRLTIRA